jgi:anhydro-N-acetylmuramic acid kinase
LTHDSAQGRVIAGAMSGTSADGVDIALTQITGRGLDMQAKLLHHHQRPYNAELRGEIFAFRADEVKSDPLPRLAQLGREISLTYAAAVNEALAAAHLTASDLAAVAAHGQTLYHHPPNTIQWLDPSLIAAEVGCPVVSDFRRADLAAGGQGAPLVPFADYVLFRHPTKNRVLLNIGGIANITHIPAGAQPYEMIAFDTGPGNCISDHLCRKFDPRGPGYDKGGFGASSGEANDKVCDFFSTALYFARKPPKSTDGPEMIALFEQAIDQAHVRDALSLNDALATAASVVAFSIYRSIRSIPPADEIIASGGGTENAAITDQIKLICKEKCTVIAESSAKEAIAFALLGAATLDGVPSNIPIATGARRAVVLGSITPKP